jgi:cytidine deaminase
MEEYPPYLFLCFCPGQHRFQLWLTWVGLRILGHGGFSSCNAFSDKPKTDDSSTSGGSNLSVEEAFFASKTVKEPSKAPARYLEIMIHNVSHTDLIMSLDAPLETQSNEGPYCLCRPRFSFMDLYCRAVLDSLSGSEEVVQFPRYQRSDDDPRYLIKEDPAGSIPAGLSLQADPGIMADLSEVRVRGRDLPRVDPESEVSPLPANPSKERSVSKFPINFIFFPLLATLLPHWRTQIEERKYPRDVKRVLILVTGVGTPRNWTHSVSGNSTEVCAQLMEHFLKLIDPGLTVVRIHSQTNIFRYDENLRFVDKEFAPIMNAWRDAHARNLPYPDERKYIPGTGMADNPFNVDWRNSMSVTLSAADGSTARTHAIRESLRPFRPTYFHFWQLKTFWHETKIVDDDLEVHSYETMETRPAVDAERLRDESLQLVVNEMKAFREEIVEIIRHGKHEMSKFWLRKTHKPVLAVLLVQSPGMRRPVLYRGTNMEVSMPTGSLCAERNVIGTALASNPQLRREDLKAIAVLAIPALNDIGEKPLGRVDSTASIGSTTIDSNLDRPIDHRLSVGSETDDWVLPVENQHSHPQGLDQSFALVPPPDENQLVSQASTDTTPVRKIRLYSKSAGRQKHKKSIFVQHSHDMNPLRPCGACNEWLKKIAECNPYFKIVTFTDGNCHGVYCQPCQQ